VHEARQGIDDVTLMRWVDWHKVIHLDLTNGIDLDDRPSAVDRRCNLVVPEVVGGARRVEVP